MRNHETVQASGETQIDNIATEKSPWGKLLDDVADEAVILSKDPWFIDEYGENNIHQAQIEKIDKIGKLDTILEANPIEQIEMLPILYERYLDTDSLGMPIDNTGIRKIFMHLRERGAKPLVRLVADSLEHDARMNSEMWLNGDVEFIDYSDIEGLLDEIPDITHEETFLARTAYNPEVKPLMDAELGFDFAKISPAAQLQLFNFMVNADDRRYNRLCTTMQNCDEKLRLKLAEGFLAADFGADFGDALLEIAGSDNFKSEQVGEILDNIEGARKSIESITNFYKGFGGEFAKEYTRAANERLTDAITVFSEIAKKGVARADLDWAGKITFDYDSAIEALQYETKSLEIISGTLSDVSNGVKGAFSEVVLRPDFERGRTLYDFYSPDHGHMLLYTRPEGSGKFDPKLEYGKVRSKYDIRSNNAGVEASISMIANPVDPFSLPNPFRPDRHKITDSGYYDPATMNKVSAIRLDREGRAPGAPADDPDRDPINPIGMVSVDLAAIGDRADTPSGKIARLISTGNQLRAAQLGGDSSLNHNTRWFDQDKYGTSKGFSDLVGYIDALAAKWCKEHKPAAGEGFTGAMRNVNRGRGRKVLKKVA